MEVGFNTNEKRARVMVNHDRLKRARTRMNLTQAELATRIGLSERQISDRESKDGVMTSSSLVAIAKELEVSIDWLCGLTGTDELHGHLQRALSDEENRLLAAYRDWDIHSAASLFAERASAIIADTLGQEAMDAVIKKLRDQ